MKIETKVKFKKTLEDLIYRFKAHDIPANSAALSFYFLQASIPLLMVLVSVVSRLLNDNVDAIYNLIDFLPDSARDMAIYAIDTMFMTTSSASVTIITVLFALWSATNGINNLITAINRAYGLEGETNALKQRIISVPYTIIFIIFLIFILVSQIYGPTILQFIRDNILTKLSDRAFGGAFDSIIRTFTSPLSRITLTIVPILIIALAFGFFYRFAPNNKENRVPFKDAFLGGLFAIVTIYIATFLYSFFLNNFSRQSVVYGALAGILALFIWLTIVTTVLILGAELIDSIKENYEIISDSEISEYKVDNKSFRETVESTLAQSMIKKKDEDVNMEKRDLRKKFRDIRFHMTDEYRYMVDYSIYSQFLNSALFKEAKSIFIYVSVADEVDTYEIIKKSLELGKEVYVPYITDTDNAIMRPARIYSLDQLGIGEFNIPTTSNPEFIENPDLTILPGLGFDRDKNRLGYGGGYYDKFLKANETIAVGFFASIVETSLIPTDEYDHKLDYIVTEKEIF